MLEREVRCPYQVFANFLKFDPEEHEIDGVYSCLNELKRDESDPIVQDNLIPFSVYKDFPNSYYLDCGRFLIIYTYDDQYLDVLEILSGDDY